MSVDTSLDGNESLTSLFVFPCHLTISSPPVKLKVPLFDSVTYLEIRWMVLLL